jgi:hypothetical protein
MGKEVYILNDLALARDKFESSFAQFSRYDVVLLSGLADMKAFANIAFVSINE